MTNLAHPQQTIMVGERPVGPGHPVYVIAEIGSNHNQSLDQALSMIDRAAETGCDAVKFQSIRFDALYHPELETEEFRKWFSQIELEEEWHPVLSERAKACGLHFLSAPTYEHAVDILEDLDVPAFKIASPQVQANLPVLRRAAATGKPVFMSIGYCDYGEISEALEVCRSVGNHSVIPLHCVSSYPAPPGISNLRFIQTLQAMTGGLVGFSDHSPGSHLPAAAVALGACVVEKHVTLDRSLPGPDHHFSLTFEEFTEMVAAVRDVEAALGDGTSIGKPDVAQDLRDHVELKAFVRHDLPAEHSVTDADLIFLRAPCKGIPACDMATLMPCITKQPVSAGTLLTRQIIELLSAQPHAVARDR